MPPSPARSTTALLLLLPLTSLSTAPAAQAAPAAPATLNPINIIASHSGRCVEVEGSLLLAGTSVAQKDCVGQPGAVWRLEESMAGRNSVNLHNPNSGKCVEIAPPAVHGVSLARLGACTGTDSTSFQLEDRGTHVWLKPLSAPGQCLEVSSGSHVNGTVLRTAACNGQSGTAFHQRAVRLGNDAPREPHKGLERVNLTSTGDQIPEGTGAGATEVSSVNRDGRFVAFVSDGNSLVPEDDNNQPDVFVRDRHEGITERVSVSSSRAQGDKIAGAPSISADGRYVAFHSAATNMVPGDTNNAWDVFVRDRKTGTTQRVSVSSTGAQGSQSSQRATISPDGRYVAFESIAPDLVPGDTNNAMDGFLHDRTTGVTERVTLTDAEGQADDRSRDVTASADGRYVAFSSLAANLVPGDSNNLHDVYLRDRVLGTTRRVSASNTRPVSPSGSLVPRVDSDGSFVVFQSDVPDLVPGDTNDATDVFVWKRRSGSTVRASVNNAGQQGTANSLHPSVSADGRFVAFHSGAANLVPGDTNAKADVFARDLLLETTVRVSVDDAGAQANNTSVEANITGDGAYVSFVSYASNLVGGDTNNATDLFVQARPQDLTFARRTP